MTGTKELQLSIIPSEFYKWGLGSQLGRGVCSTKARRAEHRFCKALWFFPAQLHRQLGRKDKTSHRSWQQGHFQCWPQPPRLHAPLNGPLPCRLKPFRHPLRIPVGKPASGWAEALANHALLCRTTMELPTALPWLQGSPHVSLCRD